MSDQHKAAARAVFEVWNSGELARLDALVAPNVVQHDPYDPNGCDGLEGMKRTIRLNHELFPDLHIAVQDQVAERDRVATRWTGSMTHAPTDKAVMITGITIDRLGERQKRRGVAEHWTCSPWCGPSGRSRSRRPKRA